MIVKILDNCIGIGTSTQPASLCAAYSRQGWGYTPTRSWLVPIRRSRTPNRVDAIKYYMKNL
jgi:hypothetical protein